MGRDEAALAGSVVPTSLEQPVNDGARAASSHPLFLSRSSYNQMVHMEGMRYNSGRGGACGLLDVPPRH